MTNINNDRERRHFRDTINTRQATPDEVAYRDGYIQGRTSKPYVHNDRLRQSNQAAHRSGMTSGVLLGILLASLVGVITASVALLSDRSEETDIITAPEAVEPSPVAVPSPQVERQTTVIERSSDRIREFVPVAPAPVENTAPAPQATTPPVNTAPATESGQFNTESSAPADTDSGLTNGATNDVNPGPAINPAGQPQTNPQ